MDLIRSLFQIRFLRSSAGLALVLGVTAACKRGPGSHPDSSRGGAVQTATIDRSGERTGAVSPSAADQATNASERVTAQWTDYSDNLKTATVNLPSSYNTSPDVFRSKSPQEPVDDYLRAAIKELGRVGYLRIPAGTYDIPVSLKGEKKPILTINNLQDKVLDFSQSTIAINEPRSLFMIKNSTRFALKNVRIVHRYPLASVGVMEARQGRLLPRVTADYRNRLKRFPENFKQVTAIYQANPAILSGKAPFMWRKEGSSFRLIDENLLANGISGWSPNSDLYDVRPNHPLLGQLTKLGNNGTKLLIKHMTYGANGITALGGSDLTFEGIVINGVGGMGFYLSDVISGVLIRNCMIKANINEDKLALFGSTADGIHLARIGENVIILNNQISDTGDDGINVYHGQFFTIESATDPQIVIRKLGRGVPQALTQSLLGDFYGSHLQVKAEAVPVVNIETLPSIVNFQRFSLTMAPGSSALYTVGDFVTLSNTNKGKVFIANNTIRNSTARGILVQARDVIVRSNVLENIARSAIKITSDTRWFFEYGLPHNIKIFDNTIVNTTWDHLDIDPWSTAPAAITALVEVDTASRADKKPYGMNGSIQNLSITQNRVSESPVALAHFGVQNLRIFNNTFDASLATLVDKRPGSVYGWNISGSVFGENAQNCQASRPSDCGP
jgi:hypothetical protein